MWYSWLERILNIFIAVWWAGLQLICLWTDWPGLIWGWELVGVVAQLQSTGTVAKSPGFNSRQLYLSFTIFKRSIDRNGIWLGHWLDLVNHSWDRLIGVPPITHTLNILSNQQYHTATPHWSTVLHIRHSYVCSPCPQRTYIGLGPNPKDCQSGGVTSPTPNSCWGEWLLDVMAVQMSMEVRK